MITFIECQRAGYASRTLDNIKLSEQTIAIALDFTTAGERLTRNVARATNSYYDLSFTSMQMPQNIERLADFLITRQPKDINIAGNGIYTFTRHRWNQEMVDLEMLSWMKKLIEALKNKPHGYVPTTIRSGGQTGIDEAALKAANKLHIPNVVCIAPKGWIFRGADSKDIANEKAFKARF